MWPRGPESFGGAAFLLAAAKNWIQVRGRGVKPGLYLGSTTWIRDLGSTFQGSVTPHHCSEQLPTKSRECRGVEIAPTGSQESWVLCPDSGSAASTLHNPFGLYSKLLSPVSSHSHPCPSRIVRRLKKTMYVRAVWTLGTLRKHKVLLSTVIIIECPSLKMTVTLLFTHHLRWKTLCIKERENIQLNLSS